MFTSWVAELTGGYFQSEYLSEAYNTERYKYTFEGVLYAYNKGLITVMDKHYGVVQISIFDIDTCVDEWDNVRLSVYWTVRRVRLLIRLLTHATEQISAETKEADVSSE